jgi:hypothetical protein
MLVLKKIRYIILCTKSNNPWEKQDFEPNRYLTPVEPYHYLPLL